MANDDLNDFFNNLFGGQGGPQGIPEVPETLTPEQELSEALAATRVHLEAYRVGIETGARSKEFFDMLPAWKSEFEHYLPTLETHEEYERCQEVFDATNEIIIMMANQTINKQLNELDIVDVTGELSADTNTNDDELDF